MSTKFSKNTPTAITNSMLIKANGVITPGTGENGIPGSTGMTQIFNSDTNSYENVDAYLELQGTDGGMLFNRMTKAQMEALNASDGMKVYVTDEDIGFWSYVDGTWVQEGTGGSSSGVQSVTATYPNNQMDITTDSSGNVEIAMAVNAALEGDISTTGSFISNSSTIPTLKKQNLRSVPSSASFYSYGGDFETASGNIITGSGNITTSSGNITTAIGNIEATTGTITGYATNGNAAIIASSGDIEANTGNVIAGTNVVAGGSITAGNGLNVTTGAINAPNSALSVGSLSINGSPASSDFVQSITAGSNVTITGTATNPVINSTAGGSGTVTSVGISGSTGLTVSGSPVTTSGTIDLTLNAELQALSALSSTGLMVRRAVNTYVTRTITSGSSNLTVSDGAGNLGNPTIDLSLTPSGLTSIGVGNLSLTGNIISSTDTNGNVIISPNGTGELQSSNNINVRSGKLFKFYNLGNTFYSALKAGSLTANITWTLPSADSSGFFKSDGAGNMSIGTAVTSITAGTSNVTIGGTATAPTISVTGSSSGTVTSITAGTGLSGGTITDSGTIALANTAVTAGSYTNTSLIVNAQGQITAASSGTAPVTSITAGTGLSVSGSTTPTIYIAITGVTTGNYTYPSAISVNPEGQITSITNGSAPVTSVSGTTNQITVSGSTTPVLSLPSSITTPGSLATTTSLSSGSTISAATTVTAGTALQVSNADSTGSLDLLSSGGFSLQMKLSGALPGNVSWNLPTSNSSGFFKNNGSGTITWSTLSTSDISNFNSAVTAYRLDQFAAPTANISLNNKNINDLADPTTSQQAATKNFVEQAVAGVSGSFPIGAMTMWCSETLPSSGWLECNGSAISRTTYATLFGILGTTWGQGDGSTTFNLPDTRGLFPRGWNHGTTKADPYNDPDASSRIVAGTGGTAGDHVGTLQADDYQAHTHTYRQPNSPNSNYNTLSGSSSAVPGNTASIATGSSGGNETRPVNFSVMFIIRVL